MEFPLISVVLPIYKVEAYLDKCIESLLDQTYSNMEIILVDDGSPDNCPQICDKYADLDERFKVLHKKNGGLISAWSAGVSAASSEYIVFVDPDDWISPRYLEIMVNALVQTDAEVVVGSMVKVWASKQTFCKISVPYGFYDSERMQNELYPVFLNAGDFELRGISTSRCAKIIKKELLCNNLKYLDASVTFSEDLSIIFPVILDAKSLYLVDDPACVYYYRYNPNSMLNAYDKKRLLSINYIHSTLIKICKEKNHSEMIAQVYADFLAASVQAFKNELINPDGLRVARKNIAVIAENQMLKDAIQMTEWKHYRKLNVLIIYCLKQYNWFHRWITTSALKCLKIIAIEYKAYMSTKFIDG